MGKGRGETTRKAKAYKYISPAKGTAKGAIAVTGVGSTKKLECGVRGTTLEKTEGKEKKLSDHISGAQGKRPSGRANF